MLFSFLSLSSTFGCKEKFNIDIKIVEFDADYELVEKVSKTIHAKKSFQQKASVNGVFPFTTASKSVRPTPTMGSTFLHCFKQIQIQPKILRYSF